MEDSEPDIKALAWEMVRWLMGVLVMETMGWFSDATHPKRKRLGELDKRPSCLQWDRVKLEKEWALILVLGWKEQLKKERL